MNRLLQRHQKNVSNFGKLSSGVTKQQRQINKQLEASERAQRQLRQQKISNFGKLASQTKKLTEVRKNKQMEAALNKYNQIGEMMATRNETPMVLGETAPSRFIQSAARLRKKAFQSEISHVDTRVNLASKQEKQARIRTVLNS
jgi:predicted 2-oxoglutarate/Fe(II)-dependent dioxygenase YbiX